VPSANEVNEAADDEVPDDDDDDDSPVLVVVPLEDLLRCVLRFVEQVSANPIDVTQAPPFTQRVCFISIHMLYTDTYIVVI
jgi:hypothetical protein